jgi:hypothetical protein
LKNMHVTAADIQTIVLDAIRAANAARAPENQLPIGPEAAVFGPGSPLDSLGLVALLIDIEDALAARGLELSLSDSRAMSQRHSPFRTVPTLTSYIQEICKQGV